MRKAIGYFRIETGLAPIPQNILTLILPTHPEQNVGTVLGEMVVRQVYFIHSKRSPDKFSITYHI